jgi:transcriptional regulator with XRE-family HTH domain
MPKRRKTDGYAERLRLALESGPHAMGIRQLGRALEAAHPDLRGASYAGVRQYVEGKVRSPRVELLRAMAAVLGVRHEWLAFDEGAMTEVEAEAERTRRELDPGQVGEMWEAAFGELNREARGLWPRKPAFHLQATSALHVLAEWLGPSGLNVSLEEEDGKLPEHARYVEAGRLLGRALWAPIEALGLHPSSWGQQAQTHYFVTATATLAALVATQLDQVGVARRMSAIANEADPEQPAESEEASDGEA